MGHLKVPFCLSSRAESAFLTCFRALKVPFFSNFTMPFLARLHEVHRAIVVTSVVRVYVYVCVRVTLSVKVFYKSISLDHVDGSR